MCIARDRRETEGSPVGTESTLTRDAEAEFRMIGKQPLDQCGLAHS